MPKGSHNINNIHTHIYIHTVQIKKNIKNTPPLSKNLLLGRYTRSSKYCDTDWQVYKWHGWSLTCYSG